MECANCDKKIVQLPSGVWIHRKSGSEKCFTGHARRPDGTYYYSKSTFAEWKFAKKMRRCDICGKLFQPLGYPSHRITCQDKKIKEGIIQ